MKIGHIYIYGVITSWQDDEAPQWGEVNIKDIRNQIKDCGDVEEYQVHINSNGGEVYEGFGIHDLFSSIGKKTTAIIEGMCASIATVIAMGCDVVKMTSASTFMIHNPFTFSVGDASDLRKQADELERIENKIVEIYQKKSNLSKEDILSYMKEETFFDIKQAKEFGFVDEEITTIKALAKITNINMDKQKIKELETKTASMEGIFNKIKALFSPLKALLLQDSAGTEIDFYELSEGDTPAVGDKARVDGANASGDYVMPSGDTYVFEDGELKEIKEGEEDETEALKQEIEDLKAKLTEAQNSLETEKQNAETLKASFETEVNNLKGEIDSIMELIESEKPINSNPNPPDKGGKTNLRTGFKQKNK